MRKIIGCQILMAFILNTGKAEIKITSADLRSFTNLGVSGDNANKVIVTFVGNAGFLVTAGDKKVLIDGTFRGYKEVYELPPDIQEKIAKAQPPFDGIDVIFATHAHGDHINADLTRQYMKNNPNTIFASTAQLTATLNDFPDRVVTFNPSRCKTDLKELRGISIEAIYLPHGSYDANKTEILNYGYIVNLNGVKLFHTGDVDTQLFSFDEFRAYQIPEKKIDFAFIQHFYLTDNPSEKKFVNEGIGSRFIIPIHYYYTTPPIDTAFIKSNYPDAVVFRHELQHWVMPVTEQSAHTKLNQVELMKKFTGSWKSELGKDTLLITDNTPFGTGMISSSQTTVRGKNFDSVKQLYGYDKKIDRFIIAEQIKSSPVIEICNAWFTSETGGEIVITNPENTPLRFTFEFMSPDLIVQRAIINSKVVKEIALIRLKNNERK
jgi:L-ascorbate metabolism protein UlaG (beta-lactamase superfamily)